ncbi:MAG: hypothetical protein ACTSW1_03600 [Candidatus Hodarchaeales archaeon]
MPGFLPTQLALESAFIGLPKDFLLQTVVILIYAILFVILAQVSRYIGRLGILDQLRRGVKS